MVVRIEKMATGALGVAHCGERTVLVSGALPGELVECGNCNDKKGYILSEAVKVIEASPDRVFPVCPYYDICGGCDFQIVSEKTSAEIKRDILKDNLRRIGGRDDIPEDVPIYWGAFSGYRHRARFHVDLQKRRCGFLARKSSELVSLESCPALSGRLNMLLEDKRKLLDAGRGAMFSNSIDRKTGFAEVQAFEGDDAISLGDERVTVNAGGIEYTVSARVFFQSNPSVLPHLLSFVREHAVGDVIMDLYSGVGTFSALFEGSGCRVYAVERDRSCLALSHINAPSALSFTADVALWGKKNGRHADTVIVDPPRTGLAPDALSLILSWKPERIIYVSCNSATLSRDVKAMEEYGIRALALFDFYPGTGHDESALVLERV